MFITQATNYHNFARLSMSDPNCGEAANIEMALSILPDILHENISAGLRLFLIMFDDSPRREQALNIIVQYMNETGDSLDLNINAMSDLATIYSGGASAREYDDICAKINKAMIIHRDI